MVKRAAVGLSILGTILTSSVASRADGPAPGRVRVHIDTPEPVTLERRTEDTPWTTACASPCDAVLPASDEYRIAGEGIHKSARFDLLTRGKDTVTLDVEPGSKMGHTAGVIMLVVGIPTAALGTLFLVVDFAVANGDTAVAEGGITALGGVALTVAGAMLVGANKTRVSEGPPPPLLTGIKLPTWRPGNELPMRGVSVPIVTYAF
jgi:hypothetical protein